MAKAVNPWGVIFGIEGGEVLRRLEEHSSKTKSKKGAVRTNLGWSNGDIVVGRKDEKVRTRQDEALLQAIESEHKRNSHKFVNQVRANASLPRDYLSERRIQKMARVLYNIDRRLESVS